MTTDEFLTQLAELAPRVKWRLDGLLIRTSSGFCPICYVAKCVGVNEKVARRLGLDGEDKMTFPVWMAEEIGLENRGRNVLRAADAFDGFDSDVRRQLLEITNLSDR